MATYNLPNTTTFKYAIDTTNDTATLGSATASGIVMGTGDDSVYLGGAYQTALLGYGSAVTGAETIIVGTDGSAAHNVVADSAAGQLNTAEIAGDNATLDIEGGATSTNPVIFSTYGYPNKGPGYLSGVSNIVIDDSPTYFTDDNNSSTSNTLGAPVHITAGSGNDVFVLNNQLYSDTLTTGGGNDTVTIDQYAYNDVVMLGSGVNTVTIEYSMELSFGSQINGGSGASNTLTLEINDDGENTGATMGDGVVGFATLNFGFSCHAVLVTNFTDTSLTVEGTTLGGDIVTLNSAGQSYDADYGYTSTSGYLYENTVTLTAGSIGPGVLLDGGVAKLELGTLILASESPSGANDYDFNGATVENFSTVLLRDSDATLDLNSASYLVDVDPSSTTPLLNLVGGAGSNSFDIFGGTFSAPEVFEAGSIINGGSSSQNTLIIGGEDSQCITYATVGEGAEAVTSSIKLKDKAFVDLTQATISGISAVDVEAGSTLVLTSAQIVGIDAYAESKGIDPNGVFANTGIARLIVEVAPGQTNLNVANLHLGTFETSGDVVIADANSTNDTIYGGSGNETIELTGTGNYWVNAGSGNDTIQVTNATGTASVLISGNAGTTDTFGFWNSSSTTLVVGDTIVGPQSTCGSLTIDVSGVVDFTNAHFVSFSNTDTIDVAMSSTAILTIEQLAILAGDGVTFSDAITPSSILQINVDTSSSLSDVFSSTEAARIEGFEGTIDVHVTYTGSATISVAMLTEGTIEIDANSGSETIDGSVEANNPSITTAGAVIDVFNFDVTNAGSTFMVLDTINLGTGSAPEAGPPPTEGGTVTNILEAGFNTNFTGATITGTLNTIEIAAGATATLNQGQIIATTTTVEDYTPGTPSSTANLTIDDITSNFAQTSLNIIDDPNAALSTPGYYYSETLEVTSSNVTIDLSSQASSDTYMITVDGDSAGLTTILAGLGPEDLDTYGTSNVFIFDVGAGTSTAFVIMDTISGDGTLETLQVGGTSSSLVNDDFRQASISDVQIFDIENSSATAIFNTSQLDGIGAHVTNSGTLVLHVNEAGDTFSLVNGTVSNVATNANFTLTNSGTVILIDNMTGTNEIVAGSGSEDIYDGQYADSIYAGSGADVIVARDGGGGMDNFYGNTSGTGVTFDFTFDGGRSTYEADTSGVSTATYLMAGVTALDPTHSTHDGNMATSFFTQDGVITGNGETTASVNIYADVDFSGASISELSSGSESIYIAGGDAAVFTNTQLATFHTDGFGITSGSTSSGLVIDVATNGLTATASGLDLSTNWSGSVDIDATSYGQTAGETIDASGLTGSYAGWLDSAISLSDQLGVFIYGGAGDTIIAQTTGGDYIQGAGAGTTIIVKGGDGDYLAAGYGNNNVISFENTSSALINAAGDVIHGGGGTGETIEIGSASGYSTGLVIFDGDASFSSVNTLASDAATLYAIDNIEFNNVTGSGTFTAEFNYSQILHDELTLTAQNPSNELSITEADTTPSNSTAVMTVEIVGAGNMDLRSVNTSGFGAYDAEGGAATVEVYDNNTTSVTVWGTDNGTADPGQEAGDAITVNGHGDSVVLGSGANSVDFLAQNVANDVKFNFAEMNNGYLGAQGSVVSGLTDSEGYVDLSGFNATAGAGGAVASSSMAGADLGVAFQSDSVVLYSTVEPSGEFIQGNDIYEPGVSQGASAIEGYFTDTSHKAVAGFVSVTDQSHDIALYYVSTTGGSTGSHVLASDVHLIGVFDAAQASSLDTAAGQIQASFFHVH